MQVKNGKKRPKRLEKTIKDINIYRLNCIIGTQQSIMAQEDTFNAAYVDFTWHKH